jgi:hypothetical protein
VPAVPKIVLSRLGTERAFSQGGLREFLANSFLTRVSMFVRDCAQPVVKLGGARE